MMNSTMEDVQGRTSTADLLISNTSQLKEKINNIPDKMGFKIGEVADYVGVKQYVLRYWETEFEVLHPKKSTNGQRFYTRKDIETALIIRKLLHEDRFSIEGARSFLKRLRQQNKSMVDLHEAEEPKADLILASSIHSGSLESGSQEVNQPSYMRKIDIDPHRPEVAQLDKILIQREKEINQYWSSSVEYFIEEVRQSRKRLLGE